MWAGAAITGPHGQPPMFRDNPGMLRAAADYLESHTMEATA